MSGFENTPHVRYYTTDKNHHKNNIGKNFSFALHTFSILHSLYKNEEQKNILFTTAKDSVDMKIIVSSNLL